MLEDIEIEINSILVRNRNLLKEKYMMGKTNIHKDELIQEGFLFSYHTHKMRNQDAEQIFEFSYDFGIGKLKGDRYEIIKLPI